MNSIRAQRLKRGLTQWQLAKAAHITTGAVWMLEHNQRLPTSDEIRAIAAALEVDVSVLGKHINKGSRRNTDD